MLSELSLLPSVLPDKWHKLAITMLFIFLTSFSLDHSEEFLRFARLANRNHQTPANFQLGDQRSRNPRTSCGDENGVVWTMRAPSQRSVKCFNRRIVDAQLANAPLRFSRELTNALDRINLRSES